jgi:hypothetical protein
MTLAVVLATEAAPGGRGAGPTAELAYGPDGTLLERLLDQFASLNVQHGQIIVRRELAGSLRERGERAGFEIIETKDLADDLRVVAELARAAREPLLILHGDIVAGDELLTRLVCDTKAPAAAVISRAPAAGAPTRPVVRLGRAISPGHEPERGLSRGVAGGSARDPRARRRGGRTRRPHGRAPPGAADPDDRRARGRGP